MFRSVSPHNPRAHAKPMWGRLLLLMWVLLLNRDLFSQQTSVIEKDLTQQFQGRIVVLRNFNQDERQHFDREGRPKGQIDAGTWTLYSHFLIDKVDIDSHRLRLRGVRVVMTFDKTQGRLAPAKTDKALQVEIEIAEKVSVQDIGAAVSRILVGNEGLAAHVPKYWQPYLTTNGSVKGSTSLVRIRTDGTPGPTAIGSVQQSRVIHQPPPRYPEQANNFVCKVWSSWKRSSMRTARSGISRSWFLPAPVSTKTQSMQFPNGSTLRR